MRSNPPGPNDPDHNESDSPTAVPDFARAWESFPQVASVRRPSVIPDPQTYHQLVDPQAIFELIEKQDNGSTEVILVVPYSCTKCRSLKQACSRARPACARCAKTGACCVALEEGYQRLPRPKVVKGKMSGRAGKGGDAEGSPSPPFDEREAGVDRTHTRRVVSGSKRSQSCESDYVPPRKKIHTRTRAQKQRAHRSTVFSSDEMDTDSDVPTSGPLARVTSTVMSVVKRGTLTWRFVNHPRARDQSSSPEQEEAYAVPGAPVPRVWTSSLEGLLAMFPELAKSTVGFSWFQFETPILLLDTNYARGHWINSTTLSIDLLWDFDCHDSDLESPDEPVAEGPSESCSDPSTKLASDNAFGCITGTTDSRPLYLSSATASPTPDVVVSVSMSDTEMLGVPQGERIIHGPRTGEGSSIRTATSDGMGSPTKLHSSHPHSPGDSQPPNSGLSSNESEARPRVPLIKPDEVETLLNSQLRFIPLLVWISSRSELMPCKLLPEYVYLCMGFFFISDLHHAVTRHKVCPASGEVQGQVCWSITLQWAPGGEDALFDTDTTPSSDSNSDLSSFSATKDLSNPWWSCPAGEPLQVDDANLHPRNSRMQIFSCIPLDLLAEFHPSEVFPRGWFCKPCGMVNTQQYFRHQVCQSTMCGSRREKGIPPGKVDPLQSLRGAYQSSTLVRPIDRIPSVVDTDNALWDDGMRSWKYCVKDGVTLCHIFTGNQERLQGDATSLLEKIQYEVLLRKEDRTSPYFFHTTRLLHPDDGSETRVPKDTPGCVRTAYYTLCDFIHRYAEMDACRLGEVRLLAWVNSGSKKGGVLRASKSPIAIHCLGSEVVLNFTPTGGYKEVTATTAPDKGKGRAIDEDQVDLLPGGPSGHLEQDREHQTLSIPVPGANGTPVDVKDGSESIVAMVVVRECHNLDAGGVVTIEADISHCDPGKEMARQEVTKPGQGRVHKKNKVTKDKNRVTVPEISMTLVHGDCAVLYGDDFECQVVRFGTTILVIGFPEET